MTQEPGWWGQHPPMPPPPPRPPERFPWVAVTVVGSILASGVGLVTLLGLMMWPYLTHD
ncbi:hypothetical protein RDV89_02030 [Nocardioides zeae]|uniref:Uncharacterized protein n=1 Tax=Nocardioides imazamoxiresistens TaxID=3231893 RepID=A0ABU3PRH1_9ACTN|nr:hypothetical protein [Nocardioides zeae]MDT9591830.1 hypothetical protein [Nocardioides zeae]